MYGDPMNARLLYMTSTVSRSGPTRQLIQLLRHLDRSRFTAEVLTLSPEPADSLLDEFRAMDIEVKSLDLSRPGLLLRGARALRDGVKRARPDLIHTHGIRSDLAVLKYRLSKLHVATVHNYPFEDYPRTYGRVFGTLMARRHIAAFRRIPCRVAVSAALSERLRERHGLDALVIRNGIDTEQFRPAPVEEKAGLKRDLGFDPSKFLVLYAGVLIPLKNPLFLIRSFIDARIPDAILALIGGGTLAEECRRAAHPSVIVRDTVKDIDRYYRAADLFVSASLSEGMPMAVLEAMASGLPVLLSDIPPHREALRNASAAGLLFEPTSAEACIAQLRSLSAEAPDVMAARGGAARASAENDFSARRMSAEYQGLYDLMLDMRD